MSSFKVRSKHFSYSFVITETSLSSSSKMAGENKQSNMKIGNFQFQQISGRKLWCSHNERASQVHSVSISGKSYHKLTQAHQMDITQGEGASSDSQCWRSCRWWKLHNVRTFLPCEYIPKHILLPSDDSLTQIQYSPNPSPTSTWCGLAQPYPSLTHPQYLLLQKRWPTSSCTVLYLFSTKHPHCGFHRQWPKNLENLWAPSPSLPTLPPGLRLEPSVMLWLNQGGPEKYTFFHKLHKYCDRYWESYWHEIPTVIFDDIPTSFWVLYQALGRAVQVGMAQHLKSRDSRGVERGVARMWGVDVDKILGSSLGFKRCLLD